MFPFTLSQAIEKYIENNPNIVYLKDMVVSDVRKFGIGQKKMEILEKAQKYFLKTHKKI